MILWRDESATVQMYDNYTKMVTGWTAQYHNVSPFGVLPTKIVSWTTCLTSSISFHDDWAAFKDLPQSNCAAWSP